MLIDFDFEQLDEIVNAQINVHSIENIIIHRPFTVERKEVYEIINIYFILFPEMAIKIINNKINKIKNENRRIYNHIPLSWEEITSAELIYVYENNGVLIHKSRQVVQGLCTYSQFYQIICELSNS